MGRRPCCSKNEELNRGSWTAMEDKILTDYVKVHGEGKWRNLPKKAGLKRCGKSCRLRWLNYLRPDIKRGNITLDEEDLIVRLHNLLGNRWSLIAGRLPGRTDNEIKNYWNTNIVKRMNQTTRHYSNPKPSNQCSTNTVVRTKATRCTKVFIETEPKSNAEIHETSSSLAMVQQNLILKDMANKTEPLDFMVDFETDDGFLSELLNTDFTQFCDFDNEVVYGDDKSSTSGHGSLSNSDPNLQSMASFLDSEINWFSD